MALQYEIAAHFARTDAAREKVEAARTFLTTSLSKQDTWKTCRIPAGPAPSPPRRGPGPGPGRGSGGVVLLFGAPLFFFWRALFFLIFFLSLHRLNLSYP